MGEIWPRYCQDLAFPLQRFGRDNAKIWPKYRQENAEMKPRFLAEICFMNGVDLHKGGVSPVCFRM